MSQFLTGRARRCPRGRTRTSVETYPMTPSFPLSTAPRLLSSAVAATLTTYDHHANTPTHLTPHTATANEHRCCLSPATVSPSKRLSRRLSSQTLRRRGCRTLLSRWLVPLQATGPWRSPEILLSWQNRTSTSQQISGGWRSYSPG